MGLIVTTFMIGLNSDGEKIGLAVLIGNIAAVIGSIVSVRMMMHFRKKESGTTEYCIPLDKNENMDDLLNKREIRDGGVGRRLLDSMLKVERMVWMSAVAIIPGVLAICTVVMILTNGPSADGHTQEQLTKVLHYFRGWEKNWILF